MPTSVPKPKLNKLMLPTAAGKLVEVRQFSNASLQASINNALAGLGPDAKGVTLQLEKNKEGLNVAIAAKLDDHWSIAGAWKREDWGNALATSVKFSWK